MATPEELAAESPIPYQGPLPLSQGAPSSQSPAAVSGGGLNLGGTQRVIPPETVNPLQQLIGNDVKKLLELQQMGPLDRFLNRAPGKERAIRENLPTMLMLQNQAAGENTKMAELQKGYMGLLIEAAKTLASSDVDHNKIFAALGPTFLKLNQLANVNVDPEHLKVAFSEPGAAENMGAVYLTSQAFSPAQRQAILQGAQGLKGTALRTYYDDAVKKKIEELTPILRQQLPSFIAEVRRGMKDPAGPLSVPEFLTAAAKADPRVQDPVVAQAFDGITKDHDFMRALGLQPMKPPTLGEEFNRQAQALYPGRDPNSLTADETKAVNASVQRNRVEVSSQQGAAGVTAKAEAERKLPLVQALKPGEHVIDTQTGAPVDKFGTTLDDIQKGGAGKRYVHLGEKEYGQWTAANETTAILKEYFDLAGKLTDQPGSNFGQALEFWAKTKTGQPNPGVALEAMRGSILRLAGAMQGSRAQLSDRDVQAIQGMLPTALDTKQTAVQRLDVVLKIIGNMQKSVEGRLNSAELRAQINQAKVATLPPDQRAIQDAQGNISVIPKSAKTPKGWKDVNR